MEYTTLKTWNEMNIIDDDFLSIFNSREIPKLKKIKIFGKKFVENNQDKCIIIYKGRIFPLQEYFTLKDSENENHIQIILIEYGIITDKSYLFHNCEHLTKFPYIEYDIVKQVDPTVKEYNELYNKYKLNLKEEDNILENAQKELIIENIYKEYNPSNYYNNKPNFNFNDSINNSQINQANPLISNLPSIKKNNLNNAYYINSIYKLCTTLIPLPDIAEWKTDKLENISHMFSGCTLLESIPDIAIWDTKSLIYMDHLFEECILLKSIPNIGKWNTSSVTNINSMFTGCISLESIPDLSNWNTKRINNISSMFSQCSKLISLPDISKWNTENVINMSNIFLMDALH